MHFNLIQFGSAVIAVLLLSAVLLPLSYFASKRHLFRYDERNPARRWCKKCGQQQNEFHHGGIGNVRWWEDMVPVRDPLCDCHRHVL